MDIKNEEIRNEQERIVEAFHLMWGNHPSPVMLLTKKHDIVATNSVAKEKGIPTGIKCHTLGDPLNHKKNCGAADAFKAGKGVRKVCRMVGTNAMTDSYWLPVGNDYMVHYGSDITAYVDPKLLKNDSE